MWVCSGAHPGGPGGRSPGGSGEGPEGRVPGAVAARSEGVPGTLPNIFGIGKTITPTEGPHMRIFLVRMRVITIDG